MTGLPFGVSVTGKPPVTPDNGTVELLQAVADVCDFFVYYHYCYWNSDIEWQSMQPYQYIIASLGNALSFGIRAGCIWLGLANYAHYWPQSDVREFHEITYTQAMELSRQNGGRVEWVESGPKGLIREKRAAWDTGHIWLQDGDTITPRLRLVDEYGLAGAMLFCPGMGDESVWQAIADWKQPKRERKDCFFRGANWCA